VPADAHDHIGGELTAIAEVTVEQIGGETGLPQHHERHVLRHRELDGAGGRALAQVAVDHHPEVEVPQRGGVRVEHHGQAPKHRGEDVGPMLLKHPEDARATAHDTKTVGTVVLPSGRVGKHIPRLEIEHDGALMFLGRPRADPAIMRDLGRLVQLPAGLSRLG
jgi:hypothetical protein